MSLFFTNGQEAQQTLSDAASAPPPSADNPPFVDLGESVNAVRRGLDEGFAGVARLGSTFANLPNNALSDTEDYAAPTDRTALSQWFENAANDLMRRRASLIPTQRLSQSQQVISGVAETLTPAILGSVGGPAGVAIGLGGSSYERTRADLQTQGVDSVTAQNAGIQDAITMAALAGVPMAAQGRLWLRATSGAAANLAIGAGMRYNTGQLLRDRGYDHLANQYKWLDPQQMMIDAIIGAAFGAIGHGGEHAPPERVMQAALDAQDNINRQDRKSVV